MRIKQKLRIELVLGLLLLGCVFVPIFPQDISLRDPLPNVVEESEDRIIYDLGQKQQKAIIHADSKASMLLQDPTVSKYVWGSGGDGAINRNGDGIFGTGNTENLMDQHSSVGLSQDLFFSFNIGTTFADPYVVKSVDAVTLYLYVSSEALEGSETVRITALNTNAKCGNGGASSCDNPEEIALSGSNPVSRKSGNVDTTTYSSTGWKAASLGSQSWLGAGDSGYFTLYLYAYSSWEDYPADYVYFSMEDSSNDPYLSIDYTLWSAPVASAGDILGEPSELLPNVTQTIYTAVTDADGRTNLLRAQLLLSIDHSSNRIVFEWTQSTDSFAVSEGDSYVDLNTTACSSAEITNGYNITWSFWVLVDWVEGYVDFGNYAQDDQNYGSGFNWNNQNSWYTDRLWIHSITAEWIDQSTNLEDGDYVTTSESLNITGYVYWHETTTLYDLSFGTPRAELVVDGTNQGATYNDSLDSADYFNISYTTPATEDWDWSLDIELDNLPTGITEGPSNDNGKNPLFLIATSSPAFGDTGTTVSISIQPATIVPVRLVGRYVSTMTYMEALRRMETNDGEGAVFYWSSTTSSFVVLEFQSSYWNSANTLTYEVQLNAANDPETITLYDFQPARTQIETLSGATPVISGTHSITDSNWNDQRMEIEASGTATETTNQITIDVLTLNFTAISESQVTTRIVNETSVLDVIALESKAPDTNFTITGIPTTYSFSYLIGEEAEYTDEIDSLGKITLYDTGVGWYYLYLDTGMTHHEVSFSPTLPDGLSIDWQIFEWYVNETHLNQMPYPLDDGFYYLLMKDGFDNTIISTNITITATDDEDLIYGFETLGVIPLYYLAIPNNDNVDYSLDLIRNDKTTTFPLGPLGITENIRAYGLESGANYTLAIYETDGVNRYYKTEYTLSMPNHAYTYDPINLVNDNFTLAFFEFRHDDYYCYLEVRTEEADATVYIEEDATAVAGTASGLAETTAFQWSKSETEGSHYVNITLTKSGYASLMRNASYVVQAASLAIETFDGIKWVSDSYVQVVLKTNWGNTSITITETPLNGETVTHTAANEGTLRWDGINTGAEVAVTFTIDGGADSLTLTDRYYYDIPDQPVGSNFAQRVKALEPRDLILPGFLLIGAFAIVNRWNTREAFKEQKRENWEKKELDKKGVKKKEDLRPLDEVDFQEESDRRFGKKRDLRKKVKRQKGRKVR